MKHNDKYEALDEEIQSIFTINKGRYGYRRITLELRRRGMEYNHKTVYKRMKVLGLRSMVRIVKYRSYKGRVGRIAPNLLGRDFSTTAPNQKWATDVTQFSLFGEKIYLSPIIDLYSGDIVSYAIARSPNMAMIHKMLDGAFKTLPDGSNLILHSDQGWHYQNPQYQKRLKDKGIRQSMSRKGNCLDNACAENFFGLLKSELLYLQDFNSLDEFIAELENYLDYYNNRRIKGKLGGLTPIEYRAIYQSTHSQI